MKPKSGRLATTAFATAALFTVISSMQATQAQERKSLRWATLDVGSYGYEVAASTAAIVEGALGGEYAVTVQPYPSASAAQKDAMNGNAEIGYTADVGMRQLYDVVEPYEGFDPSVGMLVHTWYAYPMESLMAVPAKLADQYKCWSDFSGKPVFFTTAGYMHWANWRRIFDILGYEFNHVDIDIGANADAMESGAIVGSATYTTAGRGLAAYWTETERRTDFKIVNPCPEEREKLQAAGLSIAEGDTSIPYSKDVGVDRAYGVPILFGYNVRADMDEEIVYEMLGGLYERREKLVETDPGFTPLADDFVGMQVAGISVNPDIPVHPGLARFLKDRDAWNDRWIVAGGS